MSTLQKFVFTFVIVGLVVVLVAPQTQATSQWSRKYQVSCQTCHTAFPRLNNYGEMFLRNGYQDPDQAEPDGDTKGKMVLNDDMSVDNLINHFGIRLNLTPFQMKTNSLTVDGEKQSQLTLGQNNWVQFFVAGSITKNLSIFIEMEYTEDHYHFSWYYLGLHNLNNSSLLNFQLGNVSPLEFASYMNRLRQLGPIKGDIFGVKSSGGGSPEDALNMSGSRHAIQYYGYTGPLTWWAGIGPGASAADVNDQLNMWGGLKYSLLEGSLEGSNATIWFYNGTDATNTAGPGDQITNAFTRISPQVNLRMDNWDIQAAYVMASEDNWTLTDPATSLDYSGFSIVGSYMMGKWYPTIMLDNITAADNPGMELMKFKPALSYLWKENVRFGVYGQFDLREEVEAADATADKPAYTPKNDVQFNVRIMF